MRYTFLVGTYPYTKYGGRRQVTVTAENLDQAFAKAREQLDVVADGRNQEAPVGWDLTLWMNKR